MKENFKVTEFDSLPDKPGIYGWFIYYNQSNIVMDYHKFYKSKSYSVRLTSSLREHYLVDAPALQSIQERKLNQELLERITMKFSPPIYIGITEDQTLLIRLNQHKTELIKLINGNGIFSKTPSSFAKRVKSIIEMNELDIDETNFMVKVFPVNKHEVKHIKEIEYFVNRTFHPLCGKK